MLWFYSLIKLDEFVLLYIVFPPVGTSWVKGRVTHTEQFLRENQFLVLVKPYLRLAWLKQRGLHSFTLLFFWQILNSWTPNSRSMTVSARWNLFYSGGREKSHLFAPKSTYFFIETPKVKPARTSVSEPASGQKGLEKWLSHVHWPAWAGPLRRISKVDKKNLYTRLLQGPALYITNTCTFMKLNNWLPWTFVLRSW